MQKNPTRQQRRGPAVIAATTRPSNYPQSSSKTPAIAISKATATATATATTYNAADEILKKTQQQKKKKTKIEKMGFRRTMRRWFGSRYKQMTNGEVKELDRQISAEMRAGTFRAVHRAGPRPATGDELWEEAAATTVTVEDDDNNNNINHNIPGAGAQSPAVGQMLPPAMSGTSSIIGMERPPTSISQRSRRTAGGGFNNRYYDDEYGDDYGGYQDGGGGYGYGYGYGSGNGSSLAYGSGSGGGGGASSDSGYYGRPTPPPLSSPLPMSPPPPPPLLQPQQLLYPKQHPPPWYVPGGGPFDAAEAKPESVYDAAGSRANSMRSNVTRASRRPPTSASSQQQQGGLYYPPVRPGPYRDVSGGSRAYSMQSDPGRFYARSPRPPRVPYNNGMAQMAWDGGQYYDGAGVGLGVEGGRGGYEGGGGGGYGGYRGWNGDGNIGEQEYPVVDNAGYPGESYQYPGR
ncbi:hypothetical protein VPNG_01695 [Cytospora leucostoma]|uniref:Uncharacterized protein n=1 Tax=Cytospora leucostoma TaxID=1230097 RepID=A0A423XK74_9PEZI|nr:hypothetical protein VPNG_01695 [Cytospora leucostoma]